MQASTCSTKWKYPIKSVMGDRMNAKWPHAKLTWWITNESLIVHLTVSFSPAH